MLMRLLARLFVRPKPDPDGAAGQNIYRFHDGERHRWADPIELWERVADAAGSDWPELLRTLASVPPPAPEGVDVSEMVGRLRESQRAAAAKLADAACVAFGVKPLTDAAGRPEGLTRTARVALCSNLLAYFGGLAAAARPFGSSPGPAAASPPG